MASYPVHCDWPNASSVRRKCTTLTILSQRNNTKTIKPIINEAFVASSGDIITDYNDLYCLFTRRVASHCIAPHKYYHVCISAWRNDKRYSTLLKTHVAFLSSRNVITGFESETSDCPSKFGIARLYRNSLCASQHCRITLLFQVQKTVLRKMRCTHSNLWVELFLNSVVNTT